MFLCRGLGEEQALTKHVAVTVNAVVINTSSFRMQKDTRLQEDGSIRLYRLDTAWYGLLLSCGSLHAFSLMCCVAVICRMCTVERAIGSHVQGPSSTRDSSGSTMCTGHRNLSVWCGYTLLPMQKARPCSEPSTPALSALGV